MRRCQHAAAAPSARRPPLARPAAPTIPARSTRISTRTVADAGAATTDDPLAMCEAALQERDAEVSCFGLARSRHPSSLAGC